MQNLAFAGIACLSVLFVIFATLSIDRHLKQRRAAKNAATRLDNVAALLNNVTLFGGVTTQATTPDLVLASAYQADLEHAIVIGYRKDGREYFFSSYADGGAVLWHLARAQHKLMLLADNAED
jgi:hypothetical protein